MAKTAPATVAHPFQLFPIVADGLVVNIAGQRVFVTKCRVVHALTIDKRKLNTLDYQSL